MRSLIQEFEPSFLKEKLLYFNSQQTLNPLPAPDSFISFLSDDALKKLSIYAKLLFKFNKKTDLISPCTPAQLIFRHLFDSLKALEALLAKPSCSPKFSQIVDVGSGAGLPGFVWACCLELDFKLVEPREKRTVFLNEVLFSMKRANSPLANLKVIRSRFEPNIFENNEKLSSTLVTCRALGSRKDFLVKSKETFSPKLLVSELLGSSALQAEETLREESLNVGYNDFVLVPYSDSKESGQRFLGISS